MKVGGCSFSFGPSRLDVAAQTLKGLGFDTIDLGVCLGNTQVSPFEAAKNPEAAAGAVRLVLDQFDLEPGECFVLDFGQPINHPDPTVRRESRKLFKRLARFAKLAGCPSLMLLPGITYDDLGWQASYTRSVAELRDLCEIAADAGVQLNVEPCEPSVLQTPDAAASVCHDVCGLGLTLDYSHFIDQGYSQREVEKLHPFARHFHARQATKGKRVETVEQGTIDFRRIVSLLKSEGYQGIIAVEYVECDTTRLCQVDVRSETPKMKAELEWLIAQ
jgi:sugar phosphate isomerase/epimerase